MSQKRPRSPSPESSAVHWSSVIEDRASSFQAAYSATVSSEDLCALPEFKAASHRIAAWRKPSKQRSLVGNKPLHTSGHDDDGERYAGKKLEDLLRDSKLEGAVVVARWYGGVMLGPVRFTHILDCAKEAIRSWHVAEAERSKRVKRLEDEALLKPQIVKILRQRDDSIAVLRGLLAEKKALPDRPPPSQPAAQASKPGPAYDAMDLQALKRLEKARDATIAFILAEIEKAEAQSKTEPSKDVEKQSEAKLSKDA